MIRRQAQVRSRRFAIVTGTVTAFVGIVATTFAHLPVENTPPPRLRSTLGGGPTSPVWWLLVLLPPLVMLLAGRLAPVDVVRGWCIAVGLATGAAYGVLLLIAA